MTAFIAHRRGFSLIEIAIILVVVGLLSAAVLIPSFTLREDEIYENEARRMEGIRGAIFGYAARHRTGEGAAVNVADADGLNVRPFVLPSERPFLPCPDITGDGYEDRATDATGFSAFAVTLATFTLTVSTPAAGAVVGSAVRDSFRCESPRGVLPWRTLGVPPADYWGNLYTYYVDDVFADALTGFNQNTAADIYDPRAVIVADTEIDPATGNPVLTGENLYQARDFPPLVICDGTDTCAPAPAPAVPLTLAAGQQAGVAFTVLLREFDETDVVEGVPFAVVSHGENGFGAANYETNFAERTAAADGLICTWPIGGAAFPGAVAALTVATPEAFNFPIVENAPAGAMCTDATVEGTATSDGFMISRQRVSGGADNIGSFDDIVLWVSRDELLDAMRSGGVLGAGTAPDFPALRPY
ncbi:MAG: type II secretion system protein [Gammaproteobacteria bacterium]